MIIFFGANSALALRCAEALGEEDTLIGFCRRASNETHEAYDQVFEIDYRQPHAAMDALERIEGERITVVNFAARKIDKLFINIDAADVADVLDTNLGVNFIVLPPLVRKMVSTKWGRIIFLSSTGALRGDSGLTLYSTAKTGLVGLARSLAREYGRFGITANVLSLGYFDTGLMDSIPERLRSKMITDIPSRKLGDATNIAEGIRFLIRADYVNGAVIPIDGGL